MKKLKLLIGILLFLFLICMVVILVPKNYKLSYKLNGIQIKEQYSKKNKAYYFDINYKNVTYPLYLNHNYTSKRRLIKEIKILSLDNEICLKVKYNNKYYPLCSSGDKLVDYHLLSETFLNKYFKDYEPKEDKKISTYQKIEVYNYNENDYLVWNYRGFVNLSRNDKEDLKIFKKDTYETALSYQNGDYLIFPNYDSEYFFNKLFVYDYDSGNLNDINFDFEISYDSYFLGSFKNIFYLVDRKNKVEYSINIKKSEVKIVGTVDKKGTILNDDWEEISLVKLTNKDCSFKNNSLYSFKINDNKLYLLLNKNEILVSKLKADKIIHTDNDKVFYLVEDVLYEYKIANENTKLLKYTEWKFNNDNKIFIFN